VALCEREREREREISMAHPDARAIIKIL